MRAFSQPTQGKWVEEHRSSVFAGLRKMQSSGEYCDVFLKCSDSDRTYPAHSCVISSASPVIEKLIHDVVTAAINKAMPNDSEKIVLTLPDDVSELIMESLLEFMYGDDLGICNSVAITPTAQKSLLTAACCLEISALIKMLNPVPEQGKPSDSARPPKRASAIKFQNSLKNYIGKNQTVTKKNSSSEPVLHIPSAIPSKGRKRKLRANTHKNEIKPCQNATSDNEASAEYHQNDNMENKADEKTEIGQVPENSVPGTSRSDSANVSEDEDQPKDDSKHQKLRRRKVFQPNQFTNDEYRGAEVDELSDMENDNTAQDDDPDSCQDEWKPKIGVIKEKHEVTDKQEEKMSSINKEETDDNEDRVIRKTKSSIFRGKYRRLKRKPKDSISSGSLSCSKCGEECSSENRLKYHMKSHNTKVDLMCTFCKQVFKYKLSLQRHLRWHTGDGQKCPICGKDIFSQREMSQHMTSHNSKKMRTQCLLCQKWFTSSYVMQLHMRTHTGDELFYCEICDKKFPYKSSLKTHMLLHTGEKPYMCSVCGKAFTQKIHAREHELQHAGFKRFQCTYCDRYFAHKCGLTRHVSDIHHKNRPYVCETCGKRFPRKTKLVEHTRIHTGEKPYVCDICGVKYKANRSLKFHKKNRHDIIVPNYEVAIWKRTKPIASPVAETKSEKNESYTPIFMPLENVSVDQEKEAVISDIAEEVSVITAERSPPAATALPESHFEYPITPAAINPSPTTQFETAPVENDVPQTTTSVQNPHLNTTYIVPLNASGCAGFPVQTATMQPNQGHPGMVVTYMMPIDQNHHPQNIIQPMEIVEQTPAGDNIHNLSINHSRSSSVPPMSTFRRPAVMVQKMSDVGTFQNSPSVVSLPGLQTTYQPVPLSMAINPIPHHMLTQLSGMTHGVPLPVLVPTPAASVTQSTPALMLQPTEATSSWTAQ